MNTVLLSVLKTLNIIFAEYSEIQEISNNRKVLNLPILFENRQRFEYKEPEKDSKFQAFVIRLALSDSQGDVELA